jgi:hypothetical protein
VGQYNWDGECTSGSTALLSYFNCKFSHASQAIFSDPQKCTPSLIRVQIWGAEIAEFLIDEPTVEIGQYIIQPLKPLNLVHCQECKGGHHSEESTTRESQRDLASCKPHIFWHFLALTALWGHPAARGNRKNFAGT